MRSLEKDSGIRCKRKSKFLSKDVINEFRGRGDEIHIYPLTFKEFMEAYDGDMYHGCPNESSM